MEHAEPKGLRRRRVEQLLSKTKCDPSAAEQIDVLSHHFLGQPYKSNPMIGSADTAELFTASLDGFDCVTYIETILALTRAASVDHFVEYLRKIRYEEGRIQWARRNHYTTAWIRNNVRERTIKPISARGVPVVIRERTLNIVPGLAARCAHIKCVPKSAMPRLAKYLHTGDLIFFVSTRKNLDVFHAGILIRTDQRLIMRHASRSEGLVVEQELSGFLKANRMAGVIVMRPREVTRSDAASN
jgi:N-acetylmuramoyl-L-alanine amidase-like protein